MTPNEALNLLDQLAAQVALTRADHQKVQEATNLLLDAINSNTDDK